MKVKVLQRFRDKFDHVTTYEAGEEHEFEIERAQDLVERGLVAPLIPLEGEQGGEVPPNPLKGEQEEEKTSVGEPTADNKTEVDETSITEDVDETEKTEENKTVETEETPVGEPTADNKTEEGETAEADKAEEDKPVEDAKPKKGAKK